jgi:hypothetical protein
MLIVAVLNVALRLSVYDVALSQLISLVLLVITLPLAVLFGFYTFRVGDDYDSDSLVEAGVLCIVLAVVSSIVASPAFLSGGLLAFSQGLPALGPILYFFAFLLLLVVSFLFPITFILGTSNMKEKTSLTEFSTVMTLALVGLFIPGFFALAIIQFGVALSSFAKFGETP